MAGDQCWPCAMGMCRFCTGCNCNHNLLKYNKPKKPKQPKPKKK